jgi:hypothetical protein
VTATRIDPAEYKALFRTACQQCGENELFVLAENLDPRFGPQWAIYSRRSGRPVAMYWPQGRRLFFCGGTSNANWWRQDRRHLRKEAHSCRDWKQALAAILERLRFVVRR